MLVDNFKAIIMIQAEYRKSGLVLNKLQADFMLLIAMGNSNDEIMEYLKIDQKQLSYLKFVIKVKFKTRCYIAFRWLVLLYFL